VLFSFICCFLLYVVIDCDSVTFDAYYTPLHCIHTPIQYIYVLYILIYIIGTTKRISNWDQMTEQEQTKTWERISKRNEERRQKILQQQEQQQQQQDEEEL
jgi:hypothetical protein